MKKRELLKRIEELERRADVSELRARTDESRLMLLEAKAASAVPFVPYVPYAEPYPGWWQNPVICATSTSINVVEEQPTTAAEISLPWAEMRSRTVAVEAS